MTVQDPLSKAQRLCRLCYLLYRNPQGLTASEIARFCSVSTRTAQRDLHDLDDIGVPLWDNDDTDPPRHGIIAGYYLPPVHLTLDDALSLYLAARLLARYADNYDPHIVDTLAKLATILPEPIARHVHQTIRSLGTRNECDAFVDVLATLAVAWAGGREVRIWHQAAASAEVHEHLFWPYLIEPAPIGNATYAVGHVVDLDALRTFKIERIVRAELTDAHYTIPDDFDGPALLESCWGIAYGEKTEEVVLRFAPSATRRVKETHWHPSQQLEDEPDGGCLLRLCLANAWEMVHWVRGWGPQVEVLEPGWMREQVAREARETWEVYGGEAHEQS